jgi:hypothetical protein
MREFRYKKNKHARFYIQLTVEINESENLCFVSKTNISKSGLLIWWKEE